MVVRKQRGREDLEEGAALPGSAAAGGVEDLRILHVAADVEHQQRRQDADPEQGAPGRLLGQQREGDRVEERGGPPADCPAALNRAHRLAAMLGAHHLGDQHRAHRPLAAEPQALQRAHDQQLLERVGEAAQERADREPDDGELQHLHPPDAVGEDAGEPAAHRGRDQGCGRDQARLRLAHAPGRDQRRDHEGVDHHVERVDRPPAERGDQRPALLARELTQPSEHRLLRLLLSVRRGGARSGPRRG